MARPLAAVTGATGFLGRHLIGALREAGFEVRALARRDPASIDWLGEPPQAVAGALDDERALARLAEGAAVVVHAAGLVKARSRHEFFQVNAEGARRAAEAAGAAGARLLLVSSLAARRPALSAYAASKAAGEAAAREATAADRLTIVRPPAVYGPGDRETLPVFQAAARLPVLPLPGPDSARLAMIHVADAAAQIAALAAAPGAQAVVALPGARPEGYRWREIVGAAAQAVGRGDPPLIRAPAALVAAIGALSAAAGALGGAAPMFTPGKARELLHPDWSVAPEETSGALPPCRYDLETGFADAVAWYRSRGWL